MPYDIAIIGAGPAGCTLARLLDKNYKVLLIDKRDILAENSNSKCCGGLLAPDAQQMLGRMGMAIPSSVLVDPQLFLVRTIDFDNRIERYYQRFYFNMDRLVFEQWLLSKIPASVDLALGCTFKTCEYTGEDVRFSFTYKGKTYKESAKIIIGADGGHSLVRKSVFPDKKMPETYVAIQEWFETDNSMPWYGAIFDSTITDFYSWTITKGKVLIIGSALKKNNLALDRFKMLKMKLRDNGLVYGKKILREGAFLLRPGSISSIITGNEYCALVGEAAGFISPSSAEGISFALKSAYHLASALNESLYEFHSDYSKKVSKLKLSLFGKNLKCPAMYNRFLRGMIMRSALMSTDTLF
ncbi:MAG: FAD-binding protein [Clostridiaceae bacterium]|nr:FAD-binding protein [Clostridiaceae bacterium]